MIRDIEKLYFKMGILPRIISKAIKDHGNTLTLAALRVTEKQFEAAKENGRPLKNGTTIFSKCLKEGIDELRREVQIAKGNREYSNMVEGRANADKGGFDPSDFESRLKQLWDIWRKSKRVCTHNPKTPIESEKIHAYRALLNEFGKGVVLPRIDSDVAAGLLTERIKSLILAKTTGVTHLNALPATDGSEDLDIPFWGTGAGE